MRPSPAVRAAQGPGVLMRRRKAAPTGAARPFPFSASCGRMEAAPDGAGSNGGTLMRKRFACLAVICLALALALQAGGAAEDAGILGEPFPDFTLTDSQGNVFTLSEALADHEAVLINLWATWCGPCEREFPFFSHLYETLGSRAAFIALSVDPGDTAERIEAYRQAHGIPFPMGRDEGQALYALLGTGAVPATVIVDRFGRTVFFHVGAFLSEKEAERALGAFLGDKCTETAPLTEIPPDDETAVYPVSAARSLTALNGGARSFRMRVDGIDGALEVLVIPDETARLRVDITAQDPPAETCCSFASETAAGTMAVADLYDPETRAFLLEVPMPAASDGSRTVHCLLTSWALGMEDPELVELVLIPDEKDLDEVKGLLEASGWEGVRWESAEAAAEAEAPQAYVLHVVDQYGAPVTGVYANFCTDSACALAQTDETGALVFAGAPGVYHVQLLMVPEGYSADPGFEFYTPSAYGEWVLRLRRD